MPIEDFHASSIPSIDRATAGLDLGFVSKISFQSKKKSGNFDLIMILCRIKRMPEASELMCVAMHTNISCYRFNLGGCKACSLSYKECLSC